MWKCEEPKQVTDTAQCILAKCPSLSKRAWNCFTNYNPLKKACKTSSLVIDEPEDTSGDFLQSITIILWVQHNELVVDLYTIITPKELGVLWAH